MLDGMQTFLIDEDYDFICAPISKFKSQEEFENLATQYIKQFKGGFSGQNIKALNIINVRRESVLETENNIPGNSIIFMSSANITISPYYVGEILATIDDNEYEEK